MYSTNHFKTGSENLATVKPWLAKAGRMDEEITRLFSSFPKRNSCPTLFAWLFFVCFENCGDILAPIFVKFPYRNNELAFRDIWIAGSYCFFVAHGSANLKSIRQLGLGSQAPRSVPSLDGRKMSDRAIRSEIVDNSAPSRNKIVWAAPDRATLAPEEIHRDQSSPIPESIFWRQEPRYAATSPVNNKSRCISEYSNVKNFLEALSVADVEHEDDPDAPRKYAFAIV
jgi:hypothetical protein